MKRTTKQTTEVGGKGGGKKEEFGNRQKGLKRGGTQKGGRKKVGK